MNEFAEMVKEAFVGTEHYDPSPGQEALRASILKFERRDRVVRFLSWFMVGFMGLVAFWAAWSFWVAGPGTSTKMLILYATLFLCAFGGVGFGKMFLFSIQANLNVMKELKRAQLLWSENR